MMCNGSRRPSLANIQTASNFVSYAAVLQPGCFLRQNVTNAYSLEKEQLSHSFGAELETAFSSERPRTKMLCKPPNCFALCSLQFFCSATLQVWMMLGGGGACADRDGAVAADVAWCWGGQGSHASSTQAINRIRQRMLLVLLNLPTPNPKPRLNASSKPEVEHEPNPDETRPCR